MQSLLTAINSVASIGIIFSSARMLIGATSAVYLLSKGITASEIGIMKSFQALLLMLLDFPLGVLADRKGRRICLILGGLAGASWLALTAATSTFWVLLIAEGLNALSLAAFNGAFDALLAEKYISERGRPALNRLLGDYHAVLFAMMALFSLAGGTFVSPESSFFWWVASGILLTLTALIPLLISNDSEFRKQRNEAASVAVKPSLLKLIQEDFALVLKQIWTVPEVRKLAMPFIIIGVFYQLIIPYWQLFFTNSNHDFFVIYGFKMSFFGPLFFGILVIQSLISKSLGIPSVANASQRSLLGGVAVSVVSLTLAVYFQAQLWLCIAATLGVFALVRLYTLSASAQLHNLIEDSRRASVLSALSVFTRVILVVVLPVSGFMIESFGVWCLPLLGALLTLFCMAASSSATTLKFYFKNKRQLSEPA
jgi:MFS family permease